MFPDYFLDFNDERYKITGQKIPCLHKWDTIKITRGRRHPAYRCGICEAYARRYGPDVAYMFTTGKGKLHGSPQCGYNRKYRYIVELDRDDYEDAIYRDYTCNQTGDIGSIINGDVFFSRSYPLFERDDIYPHITYPEYREKLHGF